MTASMRAHPAAEIFPLLDGEAFDHLCADIKTHGLREDIWRIWDGEWLVLDGRNRLRACEATGVEPRFSEYSGDDPAAFVLSHNLHRRHLNESQRAMVAGRIANLSNGQHKEARPCGRAVTQTEAGRLLNVSERSVRRARLVIEHAEPALVTAVESGAVTVNAAERAARLLAPEWQRALAGSEPDRDSASQEEPAVVVSDEERRRRQRSAAGKSTAASRNHGPLVQRVGELVESGLGASDIAAELGISPSTVHKAKRELGLAETPDSKLKSELQLFVASLEAVAMQAESLRPSVVNVNATREELESCSKSLHQTLRSIRSIQQEIASRAKSL